jgi:RecB family exonuclease
VTAAASRAEPAVVIGRGALATEALLLAELEALVAAARAEPRLLARPVRVIVSSRSLREHVAAKIVARLGSVAGVLVQTLHGVALEILAEAGEAAPRGDALFAVVVRRMAREEPALREALEPMDDAWAVVSAAVADLLDAGFGPEGGHREAVEDWVAEGGLAHESAARVLAVARVAERTARELERLGLGRRGVRLARAADALRRDPDSALPARAVLVHGFADATGVASDLLDALVGGCGARVFLDLPPDPAAPERDDLGAVFAERLRRRLAGVAPVLRPAEPASVPEIDGMRAPGAWSEARAVAERVRAALDGDARLRPEDVGVVARDLTAFALPLRTHFRRLGIPFSGVDAAGPSDGAGRRIHALLELATRGTDTPAERWLDARLDLDPVSRFDLRLAFHFVGAARLRDVARLDPDALLGGGDWLPLPVRRGLAEGEDEERGPVARRRGVRARALRAALASARACEDRLRSWPERVPLAAHLARLRVLAADELGWPHDSAESALLDGPLRGLEEETPPSVELELDELKLLLRRALCGAGASPLGGAGAGVQVLGAVEARARTFERLFVLGLNREVFPRPIQEDPLLPDALRGRLEQVLPEIPVKARGFDEEHYLFAQILSASPRVTLSWQVADDDGRALAVSPLVDRLRLALGEFAVDAPSLVARPDPARPAPRTAQEAALAEGLHGTPESFAALLPAALAERAEHDDAPGATPDPESLARARLAVLRELDPDPARARGLGPYFGFIGPVRQPADLRRAPLYVTQVERLVACPWQMFLSRLLGLEPPPDALDALPEASALLVGATVHDALERIVRDALGEVTRELTDAAAREARPVPWPDSDALSGHLVAAAGAVVHGEGIALPGFDALLAAAARPLVEAARERGWPAPGSGAACLGAELEGSVVVPGPDGAARPVRFRADRADRADGALRLVDYKTGRAPQGELSDKVAAGTHLQAAAYAFGSNGEGRYVYLAEESEADALAGVAAADAKLREEFEVAVRAALAALDVGSFFPRLSRVEASGPPRRCSEWCELHAACLQGDDGARRRLFEWTQREAAPASEAERALLALWRLPGREIA